METINIIIPAAGKGSRFLDKGFTTLKTFISWSNKTMLEHLIDGFQSNKYLVNIHIILRNISTPPPYKNQEYNKLIQIIEKKYKNIFFHEINLLGYLYSIYNYVIKNNKKSSTIKLDKKSMYDIGESKNLKTYLLFKGEK